MSNQFVFSNNAATTLTSAVSSGSTTLQVASGSAFPVPGAGQQFAIFMTDAATGLVHEVMYATANASNQFTVVRGQEGTSAVSWAIGDIVQHIWSAGTVMPLTNGGTSATTAIGAFGNMLRGTSNKTTSYTVAQTDNNTLIEVTGGSSPVITFPATLTAGTSVVVFNEVAGTTFVTSGGAEFDGQGAQGFTSIAPPQWATYRLQWDGATWIIDSSAATFSVGTESSIKLPTGIILKMGSFSQTMTGSTLTIHQFPGVCC